MIYIKPGADVLQQMRFPAWLSSLTARSCNHHHQRRKETNMNANPIDTLGKKLGDTALTLLIRLYPDVRIATTEQLDAACAAMRVKSRAVVDELLDDARDAPGVAHIAFQTAALTLAHEGIRVLQDARK
jgi:hypothetical protein